MKGDCLEKMQGIESGTVDLILCDPPYGTTACKWDSVIPFDAMWEQLNRIIKPNGAIVLFGSEPFSSALRMSNIKNYKYDWIYKKAPTNFLNSRHQPLRNTELVSVFYKKKPTYNKQQVEKIKYKTHNNKKTNDNKSVREYEFVMKEKDGYAEPRTLITHIKKEDTRKIVHSTQKPVALMEYLIKTYTNEGETVLDFTMGSGSTGVACVNTNRSFIGIEMDDKYFEIAKERIENIETTLLNTGEK